MLAVVVGFLFLLNGLDVVNSYVGRSFMTAIAQRERRQFILFALAYLGVFAASAVAGCPPRVFPGPLALLWRDWLTQQLVRHYLNGETYSRIRARGGIDNPDQRISEDVRTFTTSLLSFGVTFLNSVVTTVAFVGVLWSISRWLLLCAVGYAALGSLVTVVIGHRLVELQNLELKREADLRYGLMHVREHAKRITALHDESAENSHIHRALRMVVDNTGAIIGVTRNVGFFTSGFNYLVPILPIIIVAPSYMRGEIEFGVVTQAAMAFAQILGSLFDRCRSLSESLHVRRGRSSSRLALGEMQKVSAAPLRSIG